MSPLTIPATSPTKYLSGVVALNLPADGTSGDWHYEQTFLRPRTRTPRTFLAGDGQPTDTSLLLGEAGIYDCSAALDRLGIAHPAGPVYAADHVRAVADLVLGSLLRGERANHVVLDEWMPEVPDQRRVFTLLERARSRLRPGLQALVDTWIAANRTE
ncbi:MAG TPA: hypothetical protein VME66_10620 [Candidatus Acidoferrales bacterium]|nr:hypothetical protein [Candidatus Acidoferrales bacterium]